MYVLSNCFDIALEGILLISSATSTWLCRINGAYLTSFSVQLQTYGEFHVSKLLFLEPTILCVGFCSQKKSFVGFDADLSMLPFFLLSVERFVSSIVFSLRKQRSTPQTRSSRPPHFIELFTYIKVMICRKAVTKQLQGYLRGCQMILKIDEKSTLKIEFYLYKSSSSGREQFILRKTTIWNTIQSYWREDFILSEPDFCRKTWFSSCIIIRAQHFIRYSATSLIQMENNFFHNKLRLCLRLKILRLLSAVDINIL